MCNNHAILKQVFDLFFSSLDSFEETGLIDKQTSYLTKVAKWGGLNDLCATNREVRKSVAGLSAGLISTPDDSPLWKNHAKGVSTVLFSVFMAGAAHSRDAKKIRRHHWIPRSYSSIFGYGGGSTFPVAITSPIIPAITANVSVEEFTHNWPSRNERGRECYHHMIEAAFSALEYRYCEVVRKTSPLTDKDLCVLGAFCVALDARKPIAGEGGRFPDGDVDPMIRHILDVADGLCGRDGELRVAAVTTDTPMPFLPAGRIYEGGALLTPVRSTVLVLVGDGDTTPALAEKAADTYTWRTIKMSGNAIYGLSAEALEQATSDADNERK